MLNFNQELTRLYAEVKKEYEEEPFVRVDYPAHVTEDNWDNIVSDSIIPSMKGYLYAIFDADETLLYLGRAQRVMFSLKSHLIRRTSPTTCSILDDIKDLIVNGQDKHLFIKVIEVQPREYSTCFKPLLAKDYQPKLVKRIS